MLVLQPLEHLLTTPAVIPRYHIIAVIPRYHKIVIPRYHKIAVIPRYHKIAVIPRYHIIAVTPRHVNCTDSMVTMVSVPHTKALLFSVFVSVQ